MKTKRIFSARFALTALISALTLVIAFFAYNELRSDTAISAELAPTANLAKGDSVVIMDGGKSNFETIVYGTAPHSSVSREANRLVDVFYKYSSNIDIAKEGANTPTKNVVTYGRVSSVSLSVKLADMIDALPSDSFAWGIAYEDGVLAFYANSRYALEAPVSKSLSAHELFKDMYAAIEELISGNQVRVTEGMLEVYEITAEKYAAILAQDEVKYESEKDERKAIRLEFIKSELGKFNTADFGTPETGSTLTTDFGNAQSGAPDYYPTDGVHPRVLFTENDIPAIIANIESLSGSAEYKKLMSYIDSQTLDGILPEPKKQSRGYHNWDGEVLAAIQANALAYALWGYEYNGYTAIYAMKNFLLTLDIDYIYSDQCREFGMVMYIAACVYDWCYDLLSEDDKLQIALGVEHKICRGEVKNTQNGILSTSSAVKMEMGFPPSQQGAMGGHGAEYQLLRDYLAMAIAVYDELPSWYEFIGGRFYNEYVPVRKVYYGAGLYPQGMSYGPWRFMPDCYGAALIASATGKLPYGTEMSSVIYTFASNERNIGNIFTTGDCGPIELPATSLGMEALIVSHVLCNTADAKILRLMAEQLVEKSYYRTPDVTYVSLSEYFIFSSRDVGELPYEAEYRDELPLILYNGGYVGQYLVRNEWTDNAAVVMMRVGERSTGNHDHEDAGTFQIYYKGLLTGSSGGSGTYGSDHWTYYYQATVSDNGLLIFDPEKATTEAQLVTNSDGTPTLDSFGNVSYSNEAKLFYTGGQSTSEPGGFTAWEAGQYDRAEVMGYASGYSQSGAPKYAYISGDISKAYSATQQASYVGRTMLTVYTDDPEYPMIFFVFDNIDAVSDELVKKFLLQINGENAPTVDNATKTVVVEEGEGQLVLKNVLGADEINAIGGGYGQNFVINGTNCIDKSIKEDHVSQQSWGRVELSTTGQEQSLMLNVIYLSDAGNENRLDVTGVKAYDKATGGKVMLEGATVGSVTALFSTEYDRTVEEMAFTVEGTGLMTYYVGGLYEGTWRVLVDGKFVGSIYSSHNAGMVTFKAPAGKEITLTPGADMRPAGSEKLTFITSGGSFSADVPSFYIPGEEYELPTEITRGADIFLGWYLDKEYTRPITSIPADADGRLVVYAKWLAVFVEEDYSSTTMNVVDATGGSVGANGINGVITDGAITTFKTEEENGITYLLWQTKANPNASSDSGKAGGGPSLYMDAGANSIAGMSEEQISYTFKLAASENTEKMNFAFRVRNSSNPKSTVDFFSLKNGKIVFYGNEVGTLSTDEFTTVNLIIDFVMKEIRLYVDGVEYKQSVALPARSSFTNEFFAIRAGAEGAVKIALIRIAEGDVMNSESAPKNYIQFPDGVILPDGTDISYTPNEKTPLPTDGVSAVIGGVKKELVGWYLDEQLTVPVSEVPDGVSGKFTVYAKWRTVVVSEDYSDTSLNYVDQTSIYKNEGGIIYLETGGKTTTYKTENGYLFWKTSGAGATVYMDSLGTSIASLTQNKITYVISVALAGEGENMNLAVRVRNVDKTEVSLFNLSDGKIIFNGEVIASLASDKFTTVSVVVDFDLNEIRCFVSDSEQGYVRSVQLPARSSFTKEIFAIRASGEGSVKIGDIKLVEGDIVNKSVQIPAEKNYISFPSEAVIPSGVSASYTPNEKTPIPTEGVYGTVDGRKMALVGWYLDKELTTPVSVVPDGVVGKFEVYAKWIAVLADEDYSETTLDFVDKSGLYYTAPNGIKYYETDGKKVTFKTDSQDGGYLLWQQSEGSGSQILIENSAIADSESEQITYVFELGAISDAPDLPLTVRVRDAAKTDYVLFTVSEGKIMFDGQTVIALADDGFTTVNAVLDFERGEIRLAVSDSDALYERSVALPDRATFTREIFSIRATGTGAVKIGSISVYAGDATDR